jgi:hypothetical protein
MPSNTGAKPLDCLRLGRIELIVAGIHPSPYHGDWPGRIPA